MTQALAQQTPDDAARMAAATARLKKLAHPIPYSWGWHEIENIHRLFKDGRYEEVEERLTRYLYFGGHTHPLQQW